MKIVYVLTSYGRDVYYRMTLLSIVSLKRHNPTATITILTDIESFRFLEFDVQLSQIVDELVSINISSENKNYVNRFIKTQIALLTEPPFLFLDSDTLIKSSLNNLFSVECQIALATNHSARRLDEQIYMGDLDVLNELEWNIPDDIYFNGGVIYFKDLKTSMKLCDSWFKNWSTSFSKTGKFQDQPALNRALRQFNVKVLDNCWNAQVFMNPSVYVNAKILHFYGLKLPYNTLYQDLIFDVEIDIIKIKKNIKRLCDCVIPTRTQNILVKWLIRKLLNKGKLSSFEYSLLSQETLGEQVKVFLKKHIQ